MIEPVCHRKLQMESNRGVQCLTGTRDFINELRGRTFKSAEGIIKKVKSDDLSYEFIVENGFKNPIYIEKPDGLDLSTPKVNDWTELEQYIGGDRTIEVIDVESQNYLLIPFSAMVNYMKKPTRTKLINLISMECSNTRLGKFIKPPSLAVELDWVTKYWTTKRVGNDTMSKDLPPQVQKYCLISPIDAYTDFHIDFGGTSVWYHVVKGAKTFYLIRPTADNMNLYTNWTESVNRLRTFFADQVDDCYKLTLYAGNTLLLPTGWIHAVLTVEDSLVFGGNFLHSLNMEGQLAIYDLEKRTKTPQRLMYPQFEEVHWRAARGLTKELEVLNSSSSAAPLYLLNGLKTLLIYLKQWNSTPSHSASAKEKECVIKELSKHLKIADRILTTLNPPKPERESTRPRKKRVMKDFIDYSPLIHKKKSLKKHILNIEDSNNGKASEEKWDVQNGGTKVLFRKLPREQVGTLPNSLKHSKPLNNFEGNKAEKYEEDGIIIISSDSETSIEDTLESARSSNPVHSSHSFGRTHFNARHSFHTVAEFNNTEKNIDLNTEEIEALETSDSQSEGHKGVVVHQDDEYIYPSLLLSDDEFEGRKMPVKDNDTPWNPKAKVGIVAPRTDRPSRAGKQKIAVEKGLEAAASIADVATPQRPKDLGKKTIDKSSGFRGFSSDTDIYNAYDSRGTTGFIFNPSAVRPGISRSGRKNTTVKQRLSKILKLHRRQK